MKKHTVKFDVEIPATTEESQSSSSKNQSISNHHCINCQTPLYRVGIKNYAICPNCNTKNTMT
jgi:acetyl-CoA carboxylase beta subunit